MVGVGIVVDGLDAMLLALLAHALSRIMHRVRALKSSVGM